MDKKKLPCNEIERHYLYKRRMQEFEEKKWYVIRTKSGQEDNAADFFRRYGIEVYLPVLHYGWFRKKDKSVLLCNNLVFIHTTVRYILSIMHYPGLPHYMYPYIDRTRPQDIGWKQFLTVPDEEMELFVYMTNHRQLNLIDEPELPFDIGDTVHILEGNWAGYTGIVQDINPMEEFVFVEGLIDKDMRFFITVPDSCVSKIIDIHR